jgi:hypothetical protein
MRALFTVMSCPATSDIAGEGTTTAATVVATPSSGRAAGMNRRA